MPVSDFNPEDKYCILTPEEAAKFLRKSKSWIYKNWRLLGGRKLGVL